MNRPAKQKSKMNRPTRQQSKINRPKRQQSLQKYEVHFKTLLMIGMTWRFWNRPRSVSLSIETAWKMLVYDYKRALILLGNARKKWSCNCVAELKVLVHFFISFTIPWTAVPKPVVGHNFLHAFQVFQGHPTSWSTCLVLTVSRFLFSVNINWRRSVIELIHNILLSLQPF